MPEFISETTKKDIETHQKVISHEYTLCAGGCGFMVEIESEYLLCKECYDFFIEQPMSFEAVPI